MRYLIIFLFFCSNVLAENFSIECKPGYTRSNWGDKGNDIWYIMEEKKDVCRFYRSHNLANCWVYMDEKFKGEEIIFYNISGGEKFVLNRVNAAISYYYKDQDSWLKKWVYGHYYTCRKINFIPTNFYTYEEYIKDENLKNYERNRRKF